MFRQLISKLFRKKSCNNQNEKSYILSAFTEAIEITLYWEKMWFSLCIIFLFNLVFIFSVYVKINLLGFISCAGATFVCMDACEAWLKYKNRTSFLKCLTNSDADRLKAMVLKMKKIVAEKWVLFMYIRDTNNTKAFLLANIILGFLFFIGKYINGYLILYAICMLICFAKKLVPPTIRFVKKIQQHAESDGELEGLIPEISDVNIKLLSIEPEPNLVSDERQSLDYWKPDDLPLEEASDSSDNSSSLVTNLSIEKIQSLNNDVEDTDSSEDEYIPLIQEKDKLQSTLEPQAAGTWSNTAYDTLWSITGAVSKMVYTPRDDKKKQGVSSADSSDGFEMIDKNDIN